MQTPQQVLDAYFLEARCMLVEIGATLDRFDRAAARSGEAAAVDDRIHKVRDALALLAESGGAPDRAERILMMFSDPVD